MIGVGLLGAIFYGLVNSHYVGLMLGRTLGPYTDTLARAGFDSQDPDIWRQIAERHGVAILLEPRIIYQLQTSPWAGTLARLPIDGTVPREVMRDVTGADWAPDGDEFLF